MELVQILKAVAEDARIRILNVLMVSELCVGEIEYVLDINQSNASRHLSTLKNAKLIVYEKKAQWIYYKLNQDAIDEYPFLRTLLSDEFIKLKQCKCDIEKLEQYKNSGKSCGDLKTCLKGDCMGSC